MNRQQFNLLSRGLRQVATEIPDNWGQIQNNAYDNELEHYCNIFEVQSLEELENYIAHFDVKHQQYYKKRWFAAKCADCDEFLFYVNDNVEHNPDPLDKKWDIRINDHIIFDVKGTVIPSTMRNNYEDVLEDPSEMIQFFYDRQSMGVRYAMQDRLFLVHHSLVNENNSKRIRAYWESKEVIYRRYVQEVENIHFRTYSGCTASVIYMVETDPGVLRYKIDGLDNSLIRI